MFEKLCNAVRQDNIEVIKDVLKENPGLAKASDSKGLTPLHYVNSVEACNLLLDKKAEVNVGTKIENLSPLQSAVLRGNLDIVRMLLSKGALVDAQDNTGRTSLHWGIVKGISNDILETLIASGADINKKSGKNRKSPLHYASEAGNVKALELLITKGADINTVNSQGQTCIDVCKDSKTAKALGDLLRDKDANKYQKMADQVSTGQSRNIN